MEKHFLMHISGTKHLRFSSHHPQSYFHSIKSRGNFAADARFEIFQLKFFSSSISRKLF